MNPQDFLNTANVLVGSSNESDLRTSVSRSYYAVLLFYRSYLANKVGFMPEKLGAAVHKFVPECFNACGAVEVKKIGEKISRLKQDRTNADYILSKTVSSTKAKDCLESAKELISCSISNQNETEVLAQATTRAKARQLI
ncbi:MAG: HEPN domain-containing protein [Sedimentisphaerales bacterium]|jgi:uncharacterized protein (UPF0332 family)